MALTKETSAELIQVIGPFKHIEIRTTTRVKDDGVVVADNLHRDNIKCGDLNSQNQLVPTDISGQSAEVQAIAAAVWTNEVKEAYRNYLVDNLPEGFTP
tara:strand:+ start:811 stop:1107 length:297 start_codon:yes stop_codon:yes gene_type:complete